MLMFSLKFSPPLPIEPPVNAVGRRSQDSMERIFHLIASQPLAVGVIGLCLLLVVSLLLSDWAEKRRERELLLLRARLRRSQRPDPALHRALQANRPVFRLFRWEFLFLSIAFAGLWIPGESDRKALRVAARESLSMQGHEPYRVPTPADSSLQLPSLTLALPTGDADDANEPSLAPFAHAAQPSEPELLLLSLPDPDTGEPIIRNSSPGTSLATDIPALRSRSWSPM